MSSIVAYQNYTRPFGSLQASSSAIQPFGQNQQDSFVKRNWPLMLQILGFIFLVGGTVAQQLIARTIPKGKIPPDDWELLIAAAISLNPGMTRSEAITKLCTVFGDRAPYCIDGTPPIPPIPPLPDVPPKEGIPQWMIIGGIGLAAYLLFLR
jgi:hypothetical protein